MADARILGVDVGRKRVGLAVSDPTCTIARGLPTVHVRGLEHAVKEVSRAADEWDVREIVVGWPATLSGIDGEASRMVRVFADRLAAVSGRPVTTVDERFTSVLAERTLRERGGKRETGDVDRLSAAAILQTALDRARSRGEGWCE